MNMHPRGSGASLYSSGSTGSIWSTTESLSFVYTDDPSWAFWGYNDIRGAVTRRDDKRDERRVRVAAHFLRGPFAAYKSKKHHHSSHAKHRPSDARSVSSASSGSSTSSLRHGQSSRGPTPMPMGMPPGMPPQGHGYPGSPHPPPHPHHPQAQFHPQHPLPQQFGGFPHGQTMGPPPPGPMAGPPPQPGFEAGFIQIGGGGGGGGPPPHAEDPIWGQHAQYDEEVYD
ncbi:hypothetical protein F5Y17DRAFT_455864 [Xylariaceae sp. FL0594]|nr:hypothetical protein F5Y17DRAFT_455864 [Xylariaceae sp. FL0594]